MVERLEDIKKERVKFRKKMNLYSKKLEKESLKIPDLTNFDKGYIWSVLNKSIDKKDKYDNNLLKKLKK